jgi:hypothetical protein
MPIQVGQYEVWEGEIQDQNPPFGFEDFEAGPDADPDLYCEICYRLTPGKELTLSQAVHALAERCVVERVLTTRLGTARCTIDHVLYMPAGNFKYYVPEEVE